MANELITRIQYGFYLALCRKNSFHLKIFRHNGDQLKDFYQMLGKIPWKL